MTSSTLLVELLTEELPPKALPQLAAHFAQSIHRELLARDLSTTDAAVVLFASPRRLAVTIESVLAQAPAREVLEKMMPVSVALTAEGGPTPALAKKLAARGIALTEVAQFERCLDGKNDTLFYRYRAEGVRLDDVLASIVALAAQQLPIPKLMRWGDSDVQFVRPVHRLVMLHGEYIVPGQVLGLDAGRVTLGHRFLSTGEISIPSAVRYARILFEEGHVVASFAARREQIRHSLDKHAARLNARLASDDALLDEVCALLEWPVVLEAEFAAEFLAVPQECLILTMQQNQKYFPLLDANGRLMNRFLLVTNLAGDPAAIIQGNERVLRARLSDAKFFFEQDQKVPLASRVPRLADVVYHNQLGSQLERVERVQTLAGEIAALLGADVEQTRRAAWLAKADLLSEMVGEFPELQGIMGQYYARLNGEAPAVADAIEGHYHPRFAGDSLPLGAVAQAVALADKLEILLGIYGIGLVPTGDKDPFGLRRHALGVLRILMTLPLDLTELLTLAAAHFPAGKLSATVVDDVYTFCLERLKNLLAHEAPQDAIDAVLATRPRRLDAMHAALTAVGIFRTLPEASALAAANKRTRNLLKKTDGVLALTLDSTRLEDVAERALAAALHELAPQVEQRYARQDFTGALTLLAGLKTPVDDFFDQVMVLADDPVLRSNRLALLAQVADLFNRVADISLLNE